MISQWFPNPDEKRIFQALAAWEGGLSTLSYPLQPLHPLQYPRQALCNLFTRDTFGLGAYIIDSLLLFGHLALNLCQLQLCVYPATRDHFSSLWTDGVIENGFICLLLYFIFAMKLDTKNIYGNQNLPTLFHQKRFLGCCAPVKAIGDDSYGTYSASCVMLNSL